MTSTRPFRRCPTAGWTASRTFTNAYRIMPRSRELGMKGFELTANRLLAIDCWSLGAYSLKRFNVVISKDDGGVELYPMKEWLRGHLDFVPAGLSATLSTSHQLRNGLRKAGWTVQELADEVRLIVPGATYEIIDSVIGEDTDTDTAEGGSPQAAFGLEFQLRDFIAQNIEAIDVRGIKLKLYVDPAGRDGIEYPTAVGPIDILAVDSIGGFYVFELKRAHSSHRALGQLARYMGWIRQTIGKDQKVHGIIVAKEIGKSLRYAVSVVPNVNLFKYEIEFHLKAAHDLPSGFYL